MGVFAACVTTDARRPGMQQREVTRPLVSKQDKGANQHWENCKTDLKPALLQLHAWHYVTSSGDTPCC